MSCISNLWAQFFSGTSYIYDEALSKKDENFAIEEVEKWVQKYPIEETEKWIKCPILKNADIYTNKVINDLRHCPIVPANIEIIKDHLLKIAQKHDLIGQALMNKVLTLNARKDLLIYLSDELNL